jgi:hypothetical protein
VVTRRLHSRQKQRRMAHRWIASPVRDADVWHFLDVMGVVVLANAISPPSRLVVDKNYMNEKGPRPGQA